MKKNTSRHMVIKLLSTSDNESLKSSLREGEKKVCYKRTKKIMTEYFPWKQCKQQNNRAIVFEY